MRERGHAATITRLKPRALGELRGRTITRLKLRAKIRRVTWEDHNSQDGFSDFVSSMSKKALGCFSEEALGWVLGFAFGFGWGFGVADSFFFFSSGQSLGSSFKDL